MQDTPTTNLSFSSGICIEVRNHNSCDFPKGNNIDCGSTPWYIMNAIQGIWYYTYTPDPQDPENTYLGSYYLCDFYDDSELKPKQKNTYRKSISDFSDELGAFTIREPYQSDFNELFKTLLNLSPIHTIAFLARYQDIDEEHILGTFSLDAFLDMLNTGNVSFNVCYIISGVRSKTSRNKWEKANPGQTWPMDPDFPDCKQVVSHKVALADGGTNALDNIEPLPRNVHVQQHKDNGDFSRWSKQANRPKKIAPGLGQ